MNPRKTLRKLAAVAVLSGAPADAGLWNTAYYAGWVQHHLPMGGGFRPGEPAGQRDPLLQAVREAVRGQFRITRIHHGDAGVQLTFRSVIGQAYRVEASDHPTAPIWTSVARISATALATEVTVPPGPDPTRRFFRVSDDRNPPP